MGSHNHIFHRFVHLESSVKARSAALLASFLIVEAFLAKEALDQMCLAVAVQARNTTSQAKKTWLNMHPET